VSEKYKTLKPVEQLEHPDFFSDFVDLLERDNISVSFVPAIVRPYNPTLHLPTAD
jgi:aminopeptidase C